MALPVEGVTHNFWLSRTPEPTSVCYWNSHILIHHISWIPLHVVPKTFLHSSHFWSTLILLRISSSASPVLNYKCIGYSLINATCSLENTCTAPSLFVPVQSKSTANSCRSCHQALPKANLNRFYFIESFSFTVSWSLVTAAAVDLSTTCSMWELQLGRITRCYKYQSVWQGCAGTSSFAHFQHTL